MGTWVFLTAVMTAAAVSGQVQPTEAATELRIHVAPPAGHAQPVRLRNAQLLLAWWGAAEEIPLRSRYEAGELVVTVPLDRDVWASRGAVQPPDFAYVYLEFDDFVPARSERFYWLGGKAPAAAPANWETVSIVRFHFRGGLPVDIRRGEHREVSLQARRPVAKQARFLDDLGQPFPDITVDGGAFWSANNHCGYPSGLKPLFANRRPDAAGVLAVPDGDVEYGFRIGGVNHASVVGAPPHDRSFLTAFIDTSELLVRIRRHHLVPLNMRVSIAGRPAAGVPVGASVRGACGNGVTPLGRTDDGGALRISDFYPEEFEAICIGGLDGRPIWTGAAPAKGELTIDLPGVTRVGELAYCHQPQRQ